MSAPNTGSRHWARPTGRTCFSGDVSGPRLWSETRTSASRAPPPPPKTRSGTSVVSPPPVTAPGCWSRSTMPKWHPKRIFSAVARALQTVLARRLQPVAVVFSGLETFRDRLAAAGTYASRLPVEELGNLEPSAARLALVEPAAAATSPGKTRPWRSC